MPNGSAEKRHRQSLKRRMRNKSRRSEVHTGMKRFLDKVKSGDKTAAEAELKGLASLIDTAAGKGAFHRNTAARRKSRLHRMLNGMGS